ncbi:phage virion morphogenesis protein [Lonepinella sp. BR2271]|uniref:phage virion morphogenesis protein n=1 Tax=Lonepinella sp. BR2271 TaxID=3434550 RepID=UPI003F6E30C2
MSTVDEIQAKFTALLANISPQQRRKLARDIGFKLRKSQADRIAKQQNPDGTAYEPRKPQRVSKKAKNAKGRVKRKAMFAKLRTARFFKVRSNQAEVSVGFSGSGSTIANVHQYGLSSRVQRKSERKVKYAQRELLGFTKNDEELIEDLVITHLGMS